MMSKDCLNEQIRNFFSDAFVERHGDQTIVVICGKKYVFKGKTDEEIVAVIKLLGKECRIVERKEGMNADFD